MATAMTEQMVAKLQEEHVRECYELYKEQCMIRAELQRVVDLMKREMIPRERVLHDMLEKMHLAQAEMTRNLLLHHGELGRGLTEAGSSTEDGRQRLMDPLAAAQNEVNRIRRFLQEPPVTVPDLPPEVLRQVQSEVASGSSAVTTPPPRNQLGTYVTMSPKHYIV
jgi:hypothetical protein